MKNLERYDELSMKLLKIGEALISEGEEKDDFNILSTGNCIIFISSLVGEIEDMKTFTDLCSMFAAKKMMEGNELMILLSELSFKEIQELIKEIKDKK
jgi:hypothetical protein